MTDKLWRLMALLGLLLAAVPAVADDFALEPLATRNLSPVAIGFGVPTLGAARMLPAQGARVQGTIDLVSSFTRNGDGNESLFFDGETHRFALAADYGLGYGIEVGVELPLISQQGGFLDSFIEGWHDFFGLPQGERNLFPRNQMNYRYSRSDGEGFAFSDPGTALGDLALRAAWQWYRNDARERALALRAQLKLPTGDARGFAGSGSTDLALWLSGEQRGRGELGAWLLYGGGGALYAGDGERLTDQRRKLVGLVSLGLGWQPLSALGLQLQFDGHTPFYDDSDLEELGDFAGQLAIGGSCALREGTVLELAVTEDVFVATVPDVGFHLALRQRF